VKKDDCSQIPISSSEFSGVTMNRISFLSEIKNLAFESIWRAFKLKRAFIFLIFSDSPERANLTLMFFLLSFSRAGIKTLLLSSKSRADVQIKTSFSVFSTNSLTLEIMLALPLRDPVISAVFIGEIPEL